MSTKKNDSKQTETLTDTTETPKRRGRAPRTEPKPEVRAVLVNLDLLTADSFIRLAKTGKYFGVKNPTALARELILRFVANNQKTLVQLDAAASAALSEQAVVATEQPSVAQE